MKKRFVFVLLSIFTLLGFTVNGNKWLSKKHSDYAIFYTTSDKSNLKEYTAFFEDGKQSVIDFFQKPYPRSFNIYIHPNRASLDSTWQKDWNLPEFKSQCWMVASGTADKFDIISPKIWNTEACEHTYTNTLKTQQLITHELVHVFHGQHNESPDFSEVTGIDWFVEGLATYASGQCDSVRVAKVQKALSAGEIPETLNAFWAGNLRYGLSGTLVMYIDNAYGRAKLINLLEYKTLSDLLIALKTTETELLNGWQSYVRAL